jgi:hypothetical protein
MAAGSVDGLRKKGGKAKPLSLKVSIHREPLRERATTSPKPSAR